MLPYVATRLLQAIPVLVLSSVIVFLFIRAVPGDPAMVMAGQNATPEQLDALRARFELDSPLPEQYGRWVSRMLQGDLGTAYVTQRPIADLIAQRVPATLHLAFGAMAVMLLVGGPVGILSAIRPRHPLSRLAAVLTAVALATPSFWLGILLVLFFAVSNDWLPASGYVSILADPVESIKRLILPSITLGAFGTAVLIRFLKTSIAEVIGAEFVRTAYAKGLRERAVVLAHVLKIALLPVVTIMAIQFGQMLGGAVVTEAIFGWPGVGRLILDAIGNRDYLIVQSTMVLFVATFVLLNIMADVCYALLDPRIRRGL
jgi:peptide/nickel transport system permease protein